MISKIGQNIGFKAIYTDNKKNSKRSIEYLNKIPTWKEELGKIEKASNDTGKDIELQITNLAYNEGDCFITGKLVGKDSEEAVCYITKTMSEKARIMLIELFGKEILNIIGRTGENN